MEELRLGACWIQVFIAEHQHAALFICTLLRSPECARVPEMEITSRGRRDTSAITVWVHRADVVLAAVRGNRPIQVCRPSRFHSNDAMGSGSPREMIIRSVERIF